MKASGARSLGLALTFSLSLAPFLLPNEMRIQVTTSAKYTDICTLTHTAHMCSNTCIKRARQPG